MKSEDMLELSFYQEIAYVSQSHHISLVQHVETGKFYVKKVLSTYNKHVYQMLKIHTFKNIPQIYDCFEDDGRLVVIEEFINGSGLHEILGQRETLPLKEVLKLMIELCNVLSPLHKMEPPIIHRDIKPSNLLISGDGVLKLVDFNAAKQFEDGKKTDTVLIGTVNYAAPEQYGFSQSDARTDIYAIGVLMNQMLTGKMPADDMYTGPMGKIIKKCISMDPKWRYRSCEDLRKALSHVDVLLKKAEERKQRGRRLREYLPPGFRTGKLWKMAISVVGYGLIAFISVTLEPNKHITITMMHFSRFYCFLMLFSTVLFLCNYLGIHRFCPWQKNASLGSKVLGVIIGLVVFLVIITAAITVFEFFALFNQA